MRKNGQQDRTLWNISADKTINDMVVKHELMHWALGEDPMQTFQDRMARIEEYIDRNPPGITKHDADIIGWINVALDEQARADSLEAELATERQRSEENWEMLTEFTGLVTDYNKKMGVRSVFLTREFTEFAKKWHVQMTGARHHGEKT